MTKLPTSPFPELHALDEQRPMPNLGELLKGGRALPAESFASPTVTPTGPMSLPRFPQPASPAPSQPSRDSPTRSLDPLPPVAEPRSLQETLARLMETSPKETREPPPAAEDVVEDEGQAEKDAGDDQVSRPKESGTVEPTVTGPSPGETDPTTAAISPEASTTGPGEGARQPPRNATDQDLVDALQPLLEESLQQALFSRGTGLQHFLEPILRNTVRRAIAEQMESARQFRGISTIDRLRWRLQALLKSRTYDDIVFEHTRRFQVEEAFLLRRKSRSLVSYASHDPARHASVGRIQSTVRSLSQRLRAPDGSIESSFDLPGHRRALVREGRYCLLVAVLRGRSNAMVRADLDYVLRQAEDRFGDRLEQTSDAFVYVLQPILEGCLLIQSPAPPN